MVVGVKEVVGEGVWGIGEGEGVGVGKGVEVCVGVDLGLVERSDVEVGRGEEDKIGVVWEVKSGVNFIFTGVVG